MLQRDSHRQHVSAAEAWNVVASCVVVAGICSLVEPAQAVEARDVATTGGNVAARKAGSLADVGAGTLFWNHPRARLPLPMLDLRVDLAVSGVMVHGTVEQAFENPTDEVIEALYVFPLPEQAAVHHMEIRIGERRIVSVIQEKQDARRTYQRAKEEGRKAALLEQERPNLFTTAVAGINPGEVVHVRLEYVEELAYDEGAFSLVFPLTYTQRYTLPASSRDLDRGTDTSAGDGLRAATTVMPDTTNLEVTSGSATTAGASPDLAWARSPGGGVDSASDDEPGGLPPGRSVAAPPEATLVVRLQAGLPLDEVVSDSHRLTTRWEDDTFLIELADGSVPADRDFHLRFRPMVGSEPASALLTEERADGRYALLMVLPPAGALDADTGLAADTLFIIDVSGSMAGPSIAQARAALLAALDRLRPDDTFNLLAFSDRVRTFASGQLPAAEIELGRARRWVAGLAAGGGTRIDLALASGLELISGEVGHRTSRVVFLTDGAVSNEDDILALIGGRLGSVRLHTLGIGAAPNRHLMRKMARVGRGLCEFISRVDRAENRIDAFLERLARPVMTDLQLTWDGAHPAEVYPERLPDLHAGEPLFLSARFHPTAGPIRLTLTGRTATGGVDLEAAVEAAPEHAAGVATRWARAKVGALTDRLHEGMAPQAVRAAVIDVSKQFNIVTRYTSLVAVEAFPTAAEDGRLVRFRSAYPGGELPIGGTHEPLLRLAGLLLALAGGILWRVTRRVAACSGG